MPDPEEKIKILETPELSPNIDEYLETINYNLSININNHDELINKVSCYIDLDRELIKLIIKSIFLEIRNILLSGETITLYKMGKLKPTKRGIKFKMYKSFKEVLRYARRD